MNKLKCFSFLLLVLGLIGFSFSAAQAATVSPPILVEVALNTADSTGQPIITGLVKPGAEVMIYLNGSYLGDAQVNKTDTPTDNFYYRLTSELSPGSHQVTAIAKDSTSLVLSSISNALTITVEAPPAPTLIKPNKQTITGKVKPLIVGLTKTGTCLHIFIDGKYNGKTEIKVHESGTANFVYRPFLNLASGKHSAYAITEDERGLKSDHSNIIYFIIEEPLPAPILYLPIVNNLTTNAQPFIVGLAKNNQTIRVFIDQKLNGEFKTGSHESGTIDFAYQPFLPLTPGQHLVYVTAVDDRGKESQWSNIIYFSVVRTRVPTISAEAVEETGKAIVKGTEQEFDQGDERDQIEIVEPVVGEASVRPGTDVSEFIATSTEEEKEKTGLINEEKEQQSKLRLNLAIFIIFLLAVIAWIFWVNRELIKERREQDEENDKENNKKDQNSLKF